MITTLWNLGVRTLSRLRGKFSSLTRIRVGPRLRSSCVSRMWDRHFADLPLLGVTATELAILFFLTPAFEIADWIYVLQHVVVLGIALTRCPPKAQDRSVLSTGAVVVSYGYSYAQVIYLSWVPGDPTWPAGGFVMVTLAAGLSFASLLAMGRLFGIRPALRGLMMRGPYSIIRHPMYLSYMVGDVGYNLQDWNYGTVLLMMAGWTSLIYRIDAEERLLAQDPGWPKYVMLVRYRLLPGVW